MFATTPQIGVQMGRYCPFQRGHGLVTEVLHQDLQDGKIDEAVFMLGSANALTQAVPFTAAERLNIFRQSVPHEIWRALQCTVLDDTGVQLDYDDRDTDAWKNLILDQQTIFDGEFCFYTGSEEDGRILREKGFKTKVAIDRHAHPEAEGISATQVRGLIDTILDARSGLKDADLEAEAMNQLALVMAPTAVEYAIKCYQRNMQKLGLRSATT